MALSLSTLTSLWWAVNPNIYNKTNVGVGIRPTLARWDRYFGFSSSSVFGSCQHAPVPTQNRHVRANAFTPRLARCSPSRPALLCCRAATCLSSTRAAVRKTHVLLTTDAVTDHGREDTQRGLELQNVALSYMNVHKPLLSVKSIGIDDTGPGFTWYRADTKFLHYHSLLVLGRVTKHGQGATPAGGPDINPSLP